MRKIVPPEAGEIMDSRFGKDMIISLATAVNNIPYVRGVNGWYHEGSFYVVTHARSGKMKQIAENPAVAVAGEWFSGHGRAESLGPFGSGENRALAEKLEEVFSSWIHNGHSDLENPDTIILRIELTDGILFSMGKRYVLSFPNDETGGEEG